MNKTLGLILSILFVFEVFLFGIPLTTQAALPPIPQGGVVAIYLPQYSSVAFIFNVSKIPVTPNNISTLLNDLMSDFYVLLTFDSSTYNLIFPPTYGYYSTQLKSVIIVTTVLGNDVVTTSNQVPISYLQEYTGPLGAVYNYSGIAVTNLTSPGVGTLKCPNGKTLPSQVITYLSNPAGKSFYEYVQGQIINTITISGVTITPTLSNQLLVFAPFSFVSPLFIPTPEATGFFNTMQLNGFLGATLQSEASTKPYIWGRALVNVSIVDPFAVSGNYDNISFQLNYSTPGPLQINLAQMGYVAAINNYPAKFSYQSYKFVSGYYSFLGFITDGDNLTINEVPAPESGNFTLPALSGDPSFYVTLIAILPLTSTSPPNGTVLEYFSNLTIYYLNLSSGKPVPVNVTHFKAKNYTLPVYVYSYPVGSTLTITGYFNGQPYTTTIVVSSTPTLVSYTALTTLSATAYEAGNITGASYYLTSGIMSTPPSEVAIKGQTQFTAEGTFNSQEATANVTLLTNATLLFENVPLPGYSFSGIIVTPEYPIINGSIAMQYMGTAQYFTVGSEYELAILGSELPMQISTFNGELNFILSAPSYLSMPFSLTLTVPTVPAVETGTGPLLIVFETIPQYTYITLVDFGLWGNETAVVVTGYSLKGGITTVNKGYFYGIVIPPQITTLPTQITAQDFECYNAPDVVLYDPDAVLVPGYPNGQYTYAVNNSDINFSNTHFTGAIIFYGGNVYKISGTFGNKGFSKTSVGTFSYELEPIPNSKFSAYQLTFNGKTIMPMPNAPDGQTNVTALQYYADNNPTDNMYFEESFITANGNEIEPAYVAGLNVTSGNNILSPFMQIGYEEIIPAPAPITTLIPGSSEPYYDIANYVTFKIVSTPSTPSVPAGLYPADENTFVTVTTNSTFVGTTDNYKYVSTDYAVYYYFLLTKMYKVELTVQVPNITTSLYFSSSVTPLYAPYATLYFNESYYGTNLPDYLSIGTNGLLVWNAPLYQLLGVSATSQLLSKMMYVNVTLPSGTKYSIMLTTKNLTTLFPQLVAQQLQYCNGTYEFELSISGLESILHLTVTQLNGSILTVGVYDYVTHELDVATTKLVALKTLALVQTQPGLVFYFLTFKPSPVTITGEIPWFIASAMYKQPFMSFSDEEYAHTNPTSILHLNVLNITIYHNGNKAMIYYNATAKETVIVNVYGQMITIPGNVLPTIPETAPLSGLFNGTLPLTIIQNNTLTTLTFKGEPVYTNGTLAFILPNGTPVPLGPAGLFVLPEVEAYPNITVGYNANVSVTVTDSVTTLTVSTYISSANITPIRLAPIPIIPPLSKSLLTPEDTYIDNQTIVITATSPVIDIYATSVLKYPYEFFVYALVYKHGVYTGAPLYAAYQAIVPGPEGLGTSAIPYLEIAVQMAGITSLPAGNYTVVMYAVPYPTAIITISEYPIALIFYNVELVS
ncbi:S-layer protein SlaA [Sulfurisphaera javensis]|uniref:S-layer protein SlaA n=1 Tax=Sulfurisphaera javensis TaxID=2049879 RepID=A0AAT9GP53_9CREN